MMGHKLSEILHSWKSFSAKEANHILNRTGAFWQDESFDHIVRDEKNLEKFSCYIQENPKKAGLSKNEFVLGNGSASKSKEETGETPVPLRRGIRFGLVAIKNVGEAAVEAILKARNENGNFKSLSELCERVDGRSLTRKTIGSIG